MSTEKKPTSPKPRKVVVRYREFDDIAADLNQTKCMLACAIAALSQAQNDEDGSLGVQSWNVIHACGNALERIENELDGWYVSHEHKVREVTRG
jgi:hypothetical protein